MASQWILVLLILLPFFHLIVHRWRLHNKQLPQGPSRLGNGPFDMPAEPYKRFVELAKLYGTCITVEFAQLDA